MAKITKEIALKMLGDVPMEYSFWCNDGKILKNLTDLEKALKEMTDETFHYHVNLDKNDFANWVNDVIGDAPLAQDLRRSLTRSEAIKAVSNRLAMLKRQAK